MGEKKIKINVYIKISFNENSKNMEKIIQIYG